MKIEMKTHWEFSAWTKTLNTEERVTSGKRNLKTRYLGEGEKFVISFLKYSIIFSMIFL
jgi:hypothetical protein